MVETVGNMLSSWVLDMGGRNLHVGSEHCARKEFSLQRVMEKLLNG